MYIFAVGPFDPGTELDPDCGPTESGCTVTVASFPSQTGNTGKFLKTDGSAVSWGTVTSDPTFDGDRTVTRSGVAQVNAGGTTVTEFLENYFFPAVAPSASLSGGDSREIGSSTAVTLSWTATKNTNAITAINLASVSSGATITAGAGHTQNSAADISVTTPTGNTQSGSNSATTGTNTNATYTLTVTAGALSSTSSTSVNYYNRIYYGTSSVDSSISDAQIRALTYSPLSSSRAVSSTDFGSSNYVYFAWPASFEGASPICHSTGPAPTYTATAGTTTNCFKDGANNNVTSFILETRTFTNASGYSSTYNIYRSRNSVGGTFQVQ